ncbi:MAG TPA: hypothetical protein VE175_14400 [Woeseiaceae bacterium]|nr:hypothetical protein [Woeseiaceae bacterium]
MSHKAFRLIFALSVGLLLAFYAYQRSSDPALTVQKQREHAAVLAARDVLRSHVEAAELEIIDPLAPKRSVGKSYIYPAGSGWDVSGHYRRGAADEWHPFLMRLDGERSLVSLSVRDARLQAKAASDPRITAEP